VKVSVEMVSILKNPQMISLFPINAQFPYSMHATSYSNMTNKVIKKSKHAK
jgi:hypothetical protein